MPSPGRQTSGMAATSAGGTGLGGQGVASRRPPPRATTRRPGAELPESSPVASSAAPGPPCGRAPPGRRDATRAPACKIRRSSPPATGRAKSVPDSGDPRCTTGSHGDADRHSQRQTRTRHRRSRTVLLGGGSRIRALEGISRRIYSLLLVRSPPTRPSIGKVDPWAVVGPSDVEKC